MNNEFTTDERPARVGRVRRLDAEPRTPGIGMRTACAVVTA